MDPHAGSIHQQSTINPQPLPGLPPAQTRGRTLQPCTRLGHSTISPHKISTLLGPERGPDVLLPSFQQAQDHRPFQAPTYAQDLPCGETNNAADHSTDAAHQVCMKVPSRDRSTNPIAGYIPCRRHNKTSGFVQTSNNSFRQTSSLGAAAAGEPSRIVECRSCLQKR